MNKTKKLLVNSKIIRFFKDDKPSNKKFKSKIIKEIKKNTTFEKLNQKQILEFLKNRNLEDKVLNLDILKKLKQNIHNNFQIEEIRLDKIIKFIIKRFACKNNNKLLEKKYKPIHKEEIFNHKNYSKCIQLYKKLITDISSKFKNEKNIILVKGSEGNGKSTLIETIANSNDFLIEKIDVSKFGSLRKFVEQYKNLLNSENLILNYKNSEDSDKIEEIKNFQIFVKDEKEKINENDKNKKENKFAKNLQKNNFFTNSKKKVEIKSKRHKRLNLNFFNLKNREEESFLENQSSNSFFLKSLTTMETDKLEKYSEIFNKKKKFKSYKKNKKQIIKKERNSKKKLGNLPPKQNTKIFSFFKKHQDLEIMSKCSNDNFEIKNIIPWKFKKIFIFENLGHIIHDKKIKDQKEFLTDLKFFFKFIIRISFPIFIVINNGIENETDFLFKEFKKNISVFNMIDDSNLESIFFYIIIFFEKNFSEIKFFPFELKCYLEEVFDKNLRLISKNLEILNDTIVFPNIEIFKNFVKICNHNFSRIYNMIEFNTNIFFPEDKINKNQIENFLKDIIKLEINKIKKKRNKNDFLKSIKNNFSSINIDYQKILKNAKQKNIKSFFINEKFCEKRKLIKFSDQKNNNEKKKKEIKNKLKEKIILEEEFLIENIIKEFKKIIMKNSKEISFDKKGNFFNGIMEDIFNKTYSLKSKQNIFIGKHYIQNLSFGLNFFN